MSSFFSSGSKTSNSTNSKSTSTGTTVGKSNTTGNTTSTTTPFSGEALTNYNTYLGNAQNNYDSASSNLGNLISTGDYAADTSNLDTAWSGLANQDNTVLNTLNTQNTDPNSNASWVAAQDAIDSNAKRDWGAIQDQTNQNVISSGMANGSGHQSALAGASADFSSQLASDRATRWTTQYNQNTQNALEANGQLTDFYSKLADIGVDYANISESDMATLLNAYTAQNSALSAWGSAVGMGSNPTTDTSSNSTTNNSSKIDSSTTGSSKGTSSTTNSDSMFNNLMSVASAYNTFSA